MKIGAADEFENFYMTKFRQLAAPYGLFVEYTRDRAGRDIGLHLTQPAASIKGKIVTPALIWFQMKGVMKETLSLKDYKKAEEVSIVLETAHLRFWYMNLQPAYLAVYIGSADCFLAIDIKDWAHRNYGAAILQHPQKTITVKVHKRNVLDDQFFRLALDRNLVPALRSSLLQEDDEGIARFLRDSSLVKWLALCERSGTDARMRVIRWLTKLRSEVYFEGREGKGQWKGIRTHWQFMMGEVADAFPFLTLKPKKKAVEQERIELIDTGDDEGREYVTRAISILKSEDDEDWSDDDEMDHECLLAIGNDEYSYGEMAEGEYVEHEIKISLNQIGERWAATLQVLEQAEIISVDMSPHLISVAPWHARDI
jgi:hypothetical protein